MELVERLYLPRTAESRKRLFENAGGPLLSPAMDARELELFLIRFSAIGVQMTEPVEGWILRAGERCTKVGLERLGRALGIHARQEANHHLMMIEDTRTLVGRFNQRHERKLDAEELLSSGPTPATRGYVKLHEDVIAGPAPFCQLAIEFEIEGLSVTLGPKLMHQCERLLGNEILKGLSFLREHIAVDAGHTLFNMAELERVLSGEPARAEPLGLAGSAALDAYGAFLSECHSWARAKHEEFSRVPELTRAAS